MSAEEKHICQTCGAVLAAHDEFCPVCAFRGALQSDDETATEPSDPEPQATRFGHYEILRHEDGSLFELGRGAMGITYKAFDVDLRRFAALKVISPRYLADEAARSRFLREARAAGSVRHPNVASVFQLGTSQENYFYAMEFVEGETLESLIKRSTRLDAKLALEIVAQAAAGLDAIHKQSLVHRDIKPSNIMVSSAADGAVTVNIIDLGLAKTLTESESQEISVLGAFAGTPEFASPEQFTGTDVDIRSDLYSLGITLWQMLTGQPPFRGTLNAVMHQHLNSPLALEKLRHVPQPVVALVEVLLRKAPGKRFQTPAELSKVLPTVIEAIETGQSVRKTIRVFVSSNSDVQTERNLVNRIVRGVAGEFDLLVLSESSSDFQRITEDPLSEPAGTEKAEDQERQKFALCLQFWDYATQGEVRRLPHPGNFDLVVCLLGNQVGLPVHPELRLPDGGVPASGTEYEIAWAAEHAIRNDGLPILRVYRNKPKPAVSLGPRTEREAGANESDSEYDSLAEWEDKRKGTTEFNRYKTLEEFEEQFRSHFRDFIADQFKQDGGPNLTERRVRRWKSSPFRGLNVFDFEHAPIFFGRAKAVGEVLEALDQQRKAWRRLVLIVGASGSGKSSLVRAGVLPALIQPGAVEGVGLWRRAVTRPGAGGSGGDCFDALANALLDPAALPGLENPESTSAVEDLAAELRDRPEAVAVRVRDALDNAAREWKTQRAMYLRAKEEKSRGSGTTTVSGVVVARRPAEEPELPKARLALVVDQLEELFTSGFSTDIQQKYVAAIAGLVQSGRVFILTTLRSDFYSSYQQFPELTELTRPSGKVDLRPPTAYEIGNMIRLPAEAAGLQFELDQQTGQRLDEGLRDAASTTPESLPLLQHVLSLLYDKQVERGDGLLRWSDYRELGELKGALANYAEAVFATLQPNEQHAFPLVMRHLVTLGQGEEEAPNRRIAPYREFVAGDGEDEKSGAKGFVDLFIAKRLFIADTDPHGEVNISVAHEAVLREWQRIRAWLAENRDFLRMRDRLDSSLKLWLSRGKQKDDLLGPGLPLAEGEKLFKDFEPSLSQAQTDYVRASVAEQKRQHRVRDRIRYGVMAGVTAALIVAIIFGVFSYRQYRRAELAKVAAQMAQQQANSARERGDRLINFMLYDLRDKLKPIGRLDVLDEVAKKAQEYLTSLPKEPVTASRLKQQIAMFDSLGDVLDGRGKRQDALQAYQQGLTLAKLLTQQNKSNPEWQQDLSLSYRNVGDVLRWQGKFQEALDVYQQSLRIWQTLVDQDKSNSQWQRNLAVSYDRVGDAFEWRGKPQEALIFYERSQKIRQELVDHDGSNLVSQRDIAVSFVNIGDVSVAQGNLQSAMEANQRAMSIFKHLAEQDKNNSVWQRDLSVTYMRIGKVLVAQGQLPDAMDFYQKAQAIAKSLADQDKSNSEWQRVLSDNYGQISSVLLAQGKFQDALNLCQETLRIRQALADQDKSSSILQQDLGIDYCQVGDVLAAQGKLQDALNVYERSLEIAKKLVAQDESNLDWQRDLSASYEKVADELVALGKLQDGLQLYQESLKIRQLLAEQDKSNSVWQRDLTLALYKTGTTTGKIGGTDNIARARELLQTALNLAQQYRGTERQDLIDKISQGLLELVSS
jgi:serine/threonine protein kinase/tetratricopeptide (TPR) repeat protein